MNTERLNRYLSQIITIVLSVFLMSWSGAAYGQSFSGSWRTSLGALEMNTRGASVSGIYQGGNVSGSIDGRLSDDRRLLVGKWSVPGKEGHFIFRLSADGSGFTGKWWTPGETGPGQQWIGVRQDKSLRAADIEPRSFSGEWISNYGRMSLAVTGRQINGSFSGRRNQGTVRWEVEDRTGKVVGSWRDNKYGGRVNVWMLKGGGAFIGEWWYDDNEYGGYWYAVRNLAIDGCVSGDCDDGRGTYVQIDGSRHQGEWKDRMAHGPGKLYDIFGRLMHHGIWIDGIFYGTCEKGDCAGGKGTLRDPFGTVYSGTFSGYAPEGKGRFTFANGDVYSGEVKNGMPDGPGGYRFAASGDSLTGMFRRGRIQGPGTYYFHDGSIYKGNFRRGLRYGNGTMSWKNGDTYEGRWEKDLMEGKGTYRYSDGDVYEGGFKAGRKHGEGTYTFANGSVFSGNWINGEAPEFKGTSSTYGGLAETSENRSLPIMQTNADPDRCQEMTGLTGGDMVLAYRLIEETAPATTLQPATREIVLHYYVVRDQQGGGEEAVKNFLIRQKSIPNADQLRIEKVDDPNQQIKQMLNRYTHGIGQPRILTFLREFYPSMSGGK